MTATDLKIVAYRPEHAAVWRSLNETWILAGGYAIEAKDALVLGDPEGAILAQGGTIFIAELEGAPVGCCSLMAMSDGGFEVGKMAVDAAAHGRGLGHRLLDACEAHARRAGAPRLYLETNTAQTHTIALYHRFGFAELPARPTPYARCNYWMEKRL